MGDAWVDLRHIPLNDRNQKQEWIRYDSIYYEVQKQVKLNRWWQKSEQCLAGGWKGEAGAGKKIQGNFWRDRIVLNLWFSMLSPISPDSFRSYRLQPSRPLCLWDSPGKNTGVVCHFLLQGIFPTQESKQWFLCLLHWQAGSLPVLPLGKPLKIWMEWR